MADGVTIEKLQVDIEAKAESAESSLKKLAKAIERLASSTEASEQGLAGIADSIGRMSQSLAGVDTKSIDGLERMGKAISSVTAVKSDALGEVSSNIRKLNETMTGLQSRAIDRLTTSLTGLSEIKFAAQGNFTNLVAGIEGLVRILGNVNEDSAAKLEQIAVGLKRLPSFKGMEFGGLAKGLDAIGNLKIPNLDERQLATLQRLGNILQTLKQASGSSKSLQSTVEIMAGIPKKLKGFARVDIAKFTQQMQALANAMLPLSTAMKDVSQGFTALNKAGFRFNNALMQAQANAPKLEGATKSFRGFFQWIKANPIVAEIAAAIAVFRQLSRVVGGFVAKSNDYIENLNLFTVAMKEGTRSAKAYAEQAQAVLGIDASEFMRNQGMFRQVTGGFGIAAEKAELMSKNLTQVAYDLSSLFNISIEDSMQKVQSGLSGEIEPLRRLGFALENATIQRLAYDNGIQMSVNQMTAAQKAQLRFVAIMEQSRDAHHDFARTLTSPANALRVLRQQFTLLGRAIGNIFIPILQAVIPWVQAIVTVVRKAFEYIGRLVGFKMPKFDYSLVDTKPIAQGTEALNDMSDGYNNVGNAARGAKERVDEFKRTILGFDRLNVLQDAKSSKLPASAVGGGNVGGVGGVGGGMDLPLDLSKYDYNFLKGAQTLAKDAEKTIERLFHNLKGWLPWLKGALVGIATVVSYKKITALGRAIKTFFSGAPLWVSGVAAVVGIGVAIKDIYDKWARAGIDQVFGKIALSAQEAEDVAKRLFDHNEYHLKLSTYWDASQQERDLVSEVRDLITNVEREHYKLSIGVDIDKVGLVDLYKKLPKAIEDAIDKSMERISINLDALELKGGVWDQIKNSSLTQLQSLRSEAQGLQKELEDLISGHFIDGKWDSADNEKAAQQIYQNLKEIEQRVEELRRADEIRDQQAQAQTLLRATDVDYDSYNLIHENVEQQVGEVRKQSARAELDARDLADSAYLRGEIDGKSHAQAIAEAEYSRRKKDVTEAWGQILNFDTNVWSNGFKFDVSGLDATEAFKPVQDKAKDILEQFKADEMPYGLGLTPGLSKAIEAAFKPYKDHLDPQQLAGLQEMVKRQRQNFTEARKAVQEVMQSGKGLSQEVTKDIKEYYTALAMIGDTRGENFFAGEQLYKVNDTIRKALSETSGLFRSFTDDTKVGFATGMGEVSVQLKDGSLVLVDSVGEVITTINETAAKNLAELGMSIEGQMAEAMDGWVVTAKDGHKQLSFASAAGWEQLTLDNVRAFEAMGVDVGQSFADAYEVLGHDAAHHTLVLKDRISGETITMKESIIPLLEATGHDFDGALTRKYNPDLLTPTLDEASRTLTDTQHFLDNNPMSFTIKTWVESHLDLMSSAWGGLANAVIGRSYHQTISAYADGGFPDGDLFIANETGNPELVGRIGSRTAVANNGQIVEAVAKGVYDAVTRANSANRDSGDVVINLTTGDFDHGEVYRKALYSARRDGESLVTV